MRMKKNKCRILLFNLLSLLSETLFKLFFMAIGFLFVICLFNLLTSCKTQSQITQNDTVKERIIEKHDTTVVIEKDTAMAGLLLKCDSMGNVNLLNLTMEHGLRIKTEIKLNRQIDSLSNLKNKVSYQPMYIQINCKEDSFEKVIHGYREQIKEIQSHTTTTIVEKKHVPKFYKACTWGFWIIIVILVCILGFKVYKNWGSIYSWIIKMFFKIFK